MVSTWKNGIKKWIRWLLIANDVLVDWLLWGPSWASQGLFFFAILEEKVGKISAHFSQIKSGHNPGKTGQSVKIGCFRLGIFENFWPKMAICPLSAHFLPTFEKPKNLVFSRVSGLFAHFPTFFLINPREKILL